MVQSDLIRQAYQLNIPLNEIKAHNFIKSNGPSSWSYVEASCENIIIEVIKKSELHEGTLIRAYEAKGYDAKCEFSFGKRLKKAKQVNLMERELCSIDIYDESKILLNFKPFEIHTFVIN